MNNQFQNAAQHISAMSAILDDLKRVREDLPCMGCPNENEAPVISGICYGCFRRLVWKSETHYRRDGVFGDFRAMVDVEEITHFYKLREEIIKQYTQE